MRKWCVILAMCFLLPRLSLCESLTPEAAAEEMLIMDGIPQAVEPIPDTPRWTGLMAYTCRIYEQPDGESREVGRILQGEWFKMYAYYPSWAYISYGNTRGYIRRSCIDHVNTIDASTTPPYGVDLYAYTGIVADTAPVLDSPGGSELITLQEGARLALIGFQDGWGKCIFKRQYGYIDASHFSSIIPTQLDAETASW